MHKTLIGTLSIILLSLTATAQLTNGLIGHWTFNGNANDVSGNNLNGTSTQVTYVPGKLGLPNTAASFNGTSSFISIPYNSVMNTAKFSIAAMVKVNGFYKGTCQANAILWRSDQFYSGYYSLLFFDNPYTNNCNIVDTTKNVFAGQVGNLTGSNTAQWKYTPTVVPNQWYCVVTTFDSTQSKVYVDGVLMSTFNVSPGPLGSSNKGIGIGANIFNASSNYPYWLNGEIDDLRLYNRVLSPSEVSSFCGLFDTVVYIANDPSKATLCPDDTFSVAYGVTEPFNSGNTFSAELSDANGSFASPLLIGSYSSTGAGTISCTVPSGLPLGTGYRVRIKSNNPLRYSDVSIPLSIYPVLAPSVTITVTPTGQVNAGQYLTFKANAVDAGTAPVYQWTRNKSIIPGATADTLYINTLNDNDSISVAVFSSNPCPTDLSAQSNIIVAQINNSVNDIVLNNLSLFPNPNDGIFTLTADKVKQDRVNIEVLNATGTLIQTNMADINNGILYQQVNMKGHPQGIYLLRITADGKQRNIRFIKN